MITFKDYLQEKVVEPWTVQSLDAKQTIELLNSHCKLGLQAVQDNKLIYRGFKDNPTQSTAALLDASTGLRSSLSTNNIYQLMMDSSEKMVNIPSRSKSFICTFNSGTAAGYGDVWVMIPYDKTPIVGNNEPDFLYTELSHPTWLSRVELDVFSNIFIKVANSARYSGISLGTGKKANFTRDQIGEINSVLRNCDPLGFLAAWEDYFEHLLVKWPERTDAHYFMYANRLNYSDISNWYRENKKMPSFNAGGLKLYNIIKSSKTPFQDIATELITPSALGLKVTKFGDAHSMIGEVWFSGPCIAIQPKKFVQILNELKKSYNFKIPNQLKAYV